MAVMLEKSLADGAREMGLSLSREAIASFRMYYEMLAEENNKFNLTAVHGERDVAVKHFLDSLSCIPMLDPSADYVVDVGAGAGFPGLPLKICRPQIKLLLVESARKKAEFLTRLAEKLMLDKVEIKWVRAEELGRSAAYREKADTVLSRAVASLNVLAELCLPLLKVGGLFLAMKGVRVSEELADGRRAVDALGGRVERVCRVILPEIDAERNIVAIRKVEPTPDAYPRRPGIPAKRPIK